MASNNRQQQQPIAAPSNSTGVESSDLGASSVDPRALAFQFDTGDVALTSLAQSVMDMCITAFSEVPCLAWIHSTLRPPYLPGDPPSQAGFLFQFIQFVLMTTPSVSFFDDETKKDMIAKYNALKSSKDKHAANWFIALNDLAYLVLDCLMENSEYQLVMPTIDCAPFSDQSLEYSNELIKKYNALIKTTNPMYLGQFLPGESPENHIKCQMRVFFHMNVYAPAIQKMIARLPQNHIVYAIVNHAYCAIFMSLAQEWFESQYDNGRLAQLLTATITDAMYPDEGIAEALSEDIVANNMDASQAKTFADAAPQLAYAAEFAYKEIMTSQSTKFNTILLEMLERAMYVQNPLQACPNTEKVLGVFKASGDTQIDEIMAQWYQIFKPVANQFVTYISTFEILQQHLTLLQSPSTPNDQRARFSHLVKNLRQQLMRYDAPIKLIERVHHKLPAAIQSIGLVEKIQFLEQLAALDETSLAQSGVSAAPGRMAELRMFMTYMKQLIVLSVNHHKFALFESGIAYLSSSFAKIRVGDAVQSTLLAALTKIVDESSKTAIFCVMEIFQSKSFIDTLVGLETGMPEMVMNMLQKKVVGSVKTLSVMLAQHSPNNILQLSDGEEDDGMKDDGDYDNDFVS
jgi:hypothetical protein